jgi:hypothetical protein
VRAKEGKGRGRERGRQKEEVVDGEAEVGERRKVET